MPRRANRVRVGLSGATSSGDSVRSMVRVASLRKDGVRRAHDALTMNDLRSMVGFPLEECGLRKKGPCLAPDLACDFLHLCDGMQRRLVDPV